MTARPPARHAMGSAKMTPMGNAWDAGLTDGARSTRRTKLWELRHALHCSIVGTCLSVEELRTIGKRAGQKIAPTRTDYEIHALFCAASAKKCAIAKALQKALDAKFARSVRRFRDATSEDELVGLWKEAWSHGDVAGPYWAIVTHPAVTDRLVSDAFGQIHMLSHLSGAPRHDASKREKGLTAQIEQLQQEIRVLRKRINDRDRALADLHTVKRDLEFSRREVGRLRENLANHESDQIVQSLHTTVHKLTRESNTHVRMIEKLERDLSAARAANDDLRQTQSGASIKAQEFARRATRPTGPDGAFDAATDPIDQDWQANEQIPNLLGKCLLYVGGRRNSIAHLRNLVECHNGAFLHHDGGQEERKSRLNEALSQADIVACPVDCVSHNACLKAKAHCKLANKPFVLLRTASLSSLANSLDVIADHVA